MVKKESYVYLLIDPNTAVPFYVGKGTGDRDVSHLKPGLWRTPEKTCNIFLYSKIASLMENKTPPHVIRYRENLTDEEAYEIENELIKSYKRRFVDGEGTLFNLSDYKGGTYKGFKHKPWTDERRKHYREVWKKKRMFQDNDKAELKRLYVEELWTRKEIAERYNCSEVQIKKTLQRFNIKKSDDILQSTYDRRYSSKYEERLCKYCNSPFNVLKSRKKIYCCKGCSDRARLKPVKFNGVTYENKYDAHEKTGYSIGYILNAQKRSD